jgi:hypothetical protein
MRATKNNLEDEGAELLYVNAEEMHSDVCDWILVIRRKRAMHHNRVSEEAAHRDARPEDLGAWSQILR